MRPVAEHGCAASAAHLNHLRGFKPTVAWEPPAETLIGLGVFFRALLGGSNLQNQELCL